VVVPGLFLSDAVRDKGAQVSGTEAVREAYHLYYRRLVAAVYGLVGDHAKAQDIVQETFARALNRRRAFLDVVSPEAWLSTAALGGVPAPLP